jgi:thiol-disulfide isomerase/thioredoxin
VANEVLAARARLVLIRAPEIQTELALDAVQVQAKTALVDQVDLPLWKIRDLPGEQGNAQARLLHQKLRTGLAGILRPEQVQRLDQLVRRWEGWRSLQLPSVIEDLHPTERQKQQYAELLSQFQNLAGKTRGDISRAESAWIQRVLTAGQREELRGLLGDPFDFYRVRILEAKAPEFTGVDQWINSPPLEMRNLRGKVVVVNFWTHGCINCLHNLPHYRKWYAQLPRDRVTMIAIHTPETAAEFDLENVMRSVKEQDLQYPIAVDNHKENWIAWGNNVWPSVYLVDKQGYIRNWWYGELNWQGATGEKQMRNRIQQLLEEKETATIPSPPSTTASP